MVSEVNLISFTNTNPEARFDPYGDNGISSYIRKIRQNKAPESYFTESGTSVAYILGPIQNFSCKGSLTYFHLSFWCTKINDARSLDSKEKQPKAK